MKNIIKILLLIISLNCSAQMGFGTANPDASAILDLTSTNKGLLVPRMTKDERNLISAPAKGLMIFNTDTNQLEINRGASVVKTWTAIPNGAPTSLHNSVFEIGNVTTDTTIDVLAPVMSITPVAGTYWVSFSSQFNNEIVVESTTTTPVLGTAQCALDLQAAYEQLIAFPTTDSTHAPAIGIGETLFPGVYLFIAAASIAGILTLDAQGNRDALFIFKIGEVFDVGAASKIILANGA